MGKRNRNRLRRATEAVAVEQITESVETIPGRVLERLADAATGGRVFRVELVQYGTSLNGLHYPEPVMRKAARVYEGAKAFDHHRTDAELATSTVVGLVGHYRAVEATATALEADLHLLPSATHIAEALDATLVAQADGLPPVVGISHDVVGRWKPSERAGKRVREAVEIVKANSCDVVADPSAGGRATRMVAGGSGATETEEPNTMNLQELLALLRAADAAGRAALITEHQALLTEWELDEAAIGRLLDVPATPPAPVEPPAPVAAVEPEPVSVGAATEAATYGRDTPMGGLLINSALTQAGVTDARMIEALTRQVPERFTEDQLTSTLATYTALTRELEAVAGAPRVPPVQVGQEAHDANIERLDAFFAGDFDKGFHSFKEAFCVITGFNPYAQRDGEDFAAHVMRESTGQLYDSRFERATESADSTTWAQILGDSITRRMVADYNSQNFQSWRSIVSSTPPINDFRTQRVTRFGGYGALPAVAEGGPYTALTTPTDEESTYAIAKKGGTEDLTIEAIANDDVRLISMIPSRLGHAAAITLYRFVWDTLVTNAAVSYDSVALFHATHANTSAVALGGAGADALRALMRAQAGYNESRNILSLTPRYLVVPTALESLANQLANSQYALPSGAPVGAATDIPNLHQGLELIVVDHLADANDWFMVADPANVPTIEVGFYQGRQTPELFTQSDPTQGAMFSNDKLTWKIRHIYGGTVLDHRGFVRGTQP